MYALFETVTPERAAELLSKNDNNRNVSKKTVDKYASIMKAGGWEENGETICVAKDGTLKNGQHRLLAVIKANVPIKMLVAYDVENFVHEYDRGRGRGLPNILQMEGYPPSVYNTSFIGGITFILQKAINRFPSDDEVKYAIRMFGDICTEVKYLICNGANKPICKNGGCAAATLVSLYYGTREDDLEKFFKVANSGFSNSKIQSSAIVLRNYLLDHDCNTWTLKRDLYLTALYAIQDFKNGVPRQKSYSLKNTNPLDSAMIEEVRYWLEKRNS